MALLFHASHTDPVRVEPSACRKGAVLMSLGPLPSDFREPQNPGRNGAVDGRHLFAVWPQRVEVYPPDASRSSHRRCESSDFQIGSHEEAGGRSGRVGELPPDSAKA